MVNVDGLKYICVGTIQTLIEQGGIKTSESNKHILLNPMFWDLEDTYECIFTDSIKYLMHNTGTFFQIEFDTTPDEKISGINVIQDEAKRICYQKE